MADKDVNSTTPANATFASLNDLQPSPYSQMLAEHNQPTRQYTGVGSFIAMTSNYHYPSEKAHAGILTPEDYKRISEETYYYTRHHNPNFTEFEHQLCALHGGHQAICFASGGTIE